MVDILAWGLRVLLCDLYHSRVKGTLSPSIFWAALQSLMGLLQVQVWLVSCVSLPGDPKPGHPPLLYKTLEIHVHFLSPEGSSRTPRVRPREQGPKLGHCCEALGTSKKDKEEPLAATGSLARGWAFLLQGEGLA